MSETYRDDVSDVLVIADEYSHKFKNIIAETLLITAIGFSAISTNVSESATIEDSVVDRTIHLVSDSLEPKASDQSINKSTKFVSETRKIKDTVLSKRLIMLEDDSLEITDSVFDTQITPTVELVVEEFLSDEKVFESVVLKSLVKDSLGFVDSEIGNQAIVEKLKIADEVIGTKIITRQVSESIKAKDAVISTTKKSNLLEDELTIDDSEFSSDFYISLVQEQLTIADVAIDTQVTTERIRITDEVIHNRVVESFIEETLLASDKVIIRLPELVEDNIELFDSVVDTSIKSSSIDDLLQIADDVIHSNSQPTLVVEKVALGDGFEDLLIASIVVEDGEQIQDFAIQIADDSFSPTRDGLGMAWTCNTDNYAMSRYAPFTFYDIARINGELYGVAEGGIFKIGGVTDEVVSSELTTDKLDISGGILCHPVQAVTEYTTDGEIKLEIGTTQEGVYSSYEYDAKGRIFADELTNARFVFGRGLRGRHFSFKLKFKGKFTHINDLVVSATESKRRV